MGYGAKYSQLADQYRTRVTGDEPDFAHGRFTKLPAPTHLNSRTVSFLSVGLRTVAKNAQSGICTVLLKVACASALTIR